MVSTTEAIPLVGRFAPSPNGELHLGHAYSALVNQRWARRTGATLLLRMEDIDVERCTPAFAAAIEVDVAWLGVSWTPPAVRQSERFSLYGEILGRLEAMGLLYPCFCTRGDITRVVAAKCGWLRDPDGSPLYPGTCRHLRSEERDAALAAGRVPAMRLDMAAALARFGEPLGWREYGEGDTPTLVAATPAVWGDVVLARRSAPASYHLCVVCDDAAQGVTNVIRGQDLYSATGLHRLLQLLLGFPEPRYHHHRLIIDTDGRKLSKSNGSVSLRMLREANVSPATVRARLGFGDS